MTHIISIGVYGDGNRNLSEAVAEGLATVKDMFWTKVSDADLDFMDSLITKAEELSATEGTNEEHIRSIGEGWTGDEALAIAICCSLRYLLLTTARYMVDCEFFDDGSEHSTGWKEHKHRHQREHRGREQEKHQKNRDRKALHRRVYHVEKEVIQSNVTRVNPEI